MLVLGAEGANTAYTPYRVVQDASRITAQGNSENWNAKELAVSPRRQTAIIVGNQGHTWKDNGNQWMLFLPNKSSTVAYPGG